MAKTAILKTGFEAIYRSGAAHLLNPIWGGIGVIFCLHHVVPGGGLQQGFAPNTHLEITPEFLSALIGLVQRKGYEPISIAEMAMRIKSGTASRKRFAVFTLDDGYRDNLVHAMPVFKQHKCPFTVYVAPRIADGTCELWWRNLEELIATKDRVSFDIDAQLMEFDTSTVEMKWRAWRHLSPRVQAMDEHSQRDWIRRASEKHGVDINAMCRIAAMTWDETREMAREPLATIGAHTLNHYNLRKLSADEATREIVDSARLVEREINMKVEHFAYPYGNKDAAGPREFAICQNAGFQTAVVTRLGTVLPEHQHYMQALPRIMISGRYQKTSYIEALMSGIPSRLTNRFSGLNVN